MNQEPFSTERESQQPTTDTTVAKPPQAPKKKKKESLASMIFDAVEMFALAVFLVVLIFTFFVRLCRVDGESMEDTLYNNEMLLISDFAYTPRQDDVIVFHMTDPLNGLEKPLVKRVIATGGQHVEINFKTGEIKVDGVVYPDEHKVLKGFNGHYGNRAEHHYDPNTDTFSATVPEGYLFVLGDNRNVSLDSRSNEVGFVDERTVLGKLLLRLQPFTVFP